MPTVLRHLLFNKQTLPNVVRSVCYRVKYTVSALPVLWLQVEMGCLADCLVNRRLHSRAAVAHKGFVKISRPHAPSAVMSVSASTVDFRQSFFLPLPWAIGHRL